MWEWTPEQQAIIDRIRSGQTDFTFGPGSPNPTHEDLHTYVGGKFSPAGGFAVEGGVALAPKEYNMFTPEQRRALGIMDIAPKNQVGKVERYFGSPSSYSQYASNAPSPVSGGAYVASGPSDLYSSAHRAAAAAPALYGTGSNVGQMGTVADYAAARSSGNAISGLGNSLAQVGQAQARQGEQAAAQGMAQALQMLSQRRSAMSQYLPPISGGYYG